MTVLGVDGWARGWVAARLSGRRIRWSTHADVADLLAAHPDVAVIGIDMPIGRSDGPRESDLAARRWLAKKGGSPSSIFPTPTSATIEAYRDTGGDHAAAMKRLHDQPGTSIQAWRLIPKIIELRDAGDERFVEVHPECSFAELEASVVAHSKKSAKGMALRHQALVGAELDLPPLTDAPVRVPIDDLLDATVAAWSAARYAAGTSRAFPDGATIPPRIVR